MQESSLNLLVIDDDLVSREVMAAVLGMEGFRVSSAEDGSAALAMLDAGNARPELILMDSQMPGLAGAELIAELRRLVEAPIVVISASRPDEALLARADGFLLKPITVDALKVLIDERVKSKTESAQQLTTEAAEQAAIEPSSIAEDAEPVLSPVTLGQFRAMMKPAAVAEIYAALMEDFTSRLKLMDEAQAAGDRAELRRLAHAIKGGCSMAGARQAAGIAARLERLLDEQMARSTEPDRNQLDNSAHLLAELQQAHNLLKDMLEGEFPA